MVFQNGSLIDKKITNKEKICKWHQTFFKLNWEKIFKDYLRLDAIKVLDINGVLKLEVNILKQQEEEEKLLVSKKRKNDQLLFKYS